MVKHKEEAIITGGDSEYGKTSIVYIMEIKSEKWKTGPNMMQKRSNHACGIMHSDAHIGRPILIVGL